MDTSQIINSAFSTLAHTVGAGYLLTAGALVLSAFFRLKK
jgi:hypothetical protein